MSALNTQKSRCQILDVVRAIAVLLVIGNHLKIDGNSSFFAITWQRGGWIGVDLFFVLSGFLVSGLIYSEWSKTREVNIRRFLVRRAWKIYPPFWFFLIATFVIGKVRQIEPVESASLASFGCEFLFLQNYMLRIWNHTWSLAVEEHFYIGFAAIVVILLLTRRNSTTNNPFRHVQLIFICTAIFCFLFRLRHLRHDFDFFTQMTRTHDRVDALLFGVLLSFYSVFNADGLKRFLELYSVPLVFMSVLALLPAFIFERYQSPWLITYWLTPIYVASGMLLLFLIDFFGRVGNLKSLSLLEATGRYSYSIYLWHIPVMRWGLPYLQNRFPIFNIELLQMLFAVIGSIAAGVLFHRVVEAPALRVRDKLFPSRA